MKKGDKIILLIIGITLIISSVGIYIYRSSYKNAEAIAVIKQDGKVIKTICLDKINKSEKIKIPYKEDFYNVVLVEKGRIRFSDANCPDKICVKSGWLSKPGDNAACLPHRLMIKIEGKKQVDDVTY
ncbi:NusG domain II-containing protein [Haloimpatiens sp. FM7330]|uniref:NusG domain II-containing protein n=1 Tax=Haloimpatiens sp. FM7330 TaxID=3298610 RepID=UPI00363EE486